MGRSFPGDKYGKLFQAKRTFSLHVQGLDRSWNMGRSWKKESSGLAVKEGSRVSQPGDLVFTL